MKARFDQEGKGIKMEEIIRIEKPWYTENWYDEDLRNALEEAGILASNKNVERLKEACRNIFDDKSARNEMLVNMAMDIFG